MLASERSKQINILFTGPRGAGKSSLINSIVSAFNNRIESVNPAEGGEVRCTHNLYKTEIPFNGGNRSADGSSIMLWDSPGLEEDANAPFYAKEQFLSILRGRFHDGQERVAEVDIHGWGVRLRSSPGIEDRMHVVVFCVPAHNVRDGMDGHMMGKMKRMIAELEVARGDVLGRREYIESCGLIAQSDRWIN